MENFDWKSTIKINILKLRIGGLWPKGDESYKFNFYTLWAAIAFLFLTFLHNFFQAINLIFIFKDLKAVTSIIYVNLSELQGIVKGYCIFRTMPILKQLMVTLNSDMFKPKDERQRRLVEPNLKFWRYFYMAFWGVGGGAIFFWLTTPVLDKTVKHHRLPFMAWYPFNTKISPNYEIAYIHQIFGILSVAIATMGVDTLIAAITMYTGAQLDILCDDLRHIECSKFNSQLLKCIQHHKAIIEFSADSNKFFAWIVFTQFFISALSIGITMFQMTTVVPLSSEFYSLMAFESAIIVEIFMYCWFGNEVEEKSKNIIYAAFESDWTDASLEAKKNIAIFMANCQQPIRTTSALNLFNLSLQTFLKILRASWSYFTLLNQMG